jgi:plasmid stabilization system protein ParE
MKVRFTATALAEIDDIFAYLSIRNANAASSVVARVDRTIARLADFPFMAGMSDIDTVRRIPLGRYPFVIFYTVSSEEVVILHVRHGARRSPFDDQQ